MDLHKRMFGVDAPTKDNDYLLQADYKISRLIKMYVRFKSETKEEELPESSAISGKRKANFRFHINYKEVRIGVLQTDLKLH